VHQPPRVEAVQRIKLSRKNQPKGIIYSYRQSHTGHRTPQQKFLLFKYLAPQLLSA
jgi:hypothetical protein